MSAPASPSGPSAPSGGILQTEIDSSPLEGISDIVSSIPDDDPGDTTERFERDRKVTVTEDELRMVLCSDEELEAHMAACASPADQIELDSLQLPAPPVMSPDGSSKKSARLGETSEVSPSSRTLSQASSCLSSISVRPRARNAELQDAVLAGDVEAVKQLIAGGSSVNAPFTRDLVTSNESEAEAWTPLLRQITGGPGEQEFMTLLHLLSSRIDHPNCVALIETIIDSEADLNARSCMGDTPLMRACLYKHLDAVEALLAHGAYVHPEDDGGLNALGYAVTTKPSASSEVVLQLVALLAKKGANMDDGGAKEPLLEAIRQSNNALVIALIELGAKPRFIHEAVEMAPVDIVRSLLAGQANVMEVDKSHEGRFILDVAFSRGDEEITSLIRDFIGDLERQGIRPPAKEEEGSKQRVAFARAVGRRSLILTPDVISSKPKGFSRQVAAKVLPRTRALCRKVNVNKWFQLAMLLALMGALFLPDTWIMLDIVNYLVLDLLLIFILCLFVLEFFVQSVGFWKTYMFSFFFWMDLLGAVSLMIDFSFNPLDFAGNAQVMRAARITKLGARAGRFTKLVKLLRFLPGMQQQGASTGTAKVISHTLITALSTRTSVLIIVMVMVLPIFDFVTYPQDDHSMVAWLEHIDLVLLYYLDEASPTIDDFNSFYSESSGKSYFPYEVSWDFNGTVESRRLYGRTAPLRKGSKLTISSGGASGAKALFNFTEPFMDESRSQILLLCCIIFFMVGFSLLLSNSVSAIVLRPLENLLSGVQKMASTIFKSVANMHTRLKQEVGDETEKRMSHQEGVVGISNAFGNETHLLEKVVEKMAALSEITVKKSQIDAEALEQLGENDRAVIQGFGTAPTVIQVNRISSDSTSAQGGGTVELVAAIERHFEDAGISWAHVDSWDLNVLELEDKQLHALCLCFLIFHHGDQPHTSADGVDLQLRFNNFIEVAAGGYISPKKVPYHNWFHAVDVAHTSFRMLNICETDHFLVSLERFALIASAICHDIGHGGVNNPFLVETAAELAICYNDHSPLENMHCAKLFEIVNQPKTAIFHGLEKAQYRDVRQICIEAILHTDNTHHFTMLKDLQLLYEVNSAVFDVSRQMYRTSPSNFPPKEVVDVFRTNDVKKTLRNLVLHFCDVSNPMKPFEICKSWAWKIMEEFFSQGDMEKELGIAVQPLNDRTKINKAYSQVGFIEFFVAPLSFATVKLMPPMEQCVEQLLLNLTSWKREWVTTTMPQPDSEEQAKLQERIAKLEAKHRN